MPKSSRPSQGWDDTSHHHQQCSRLSQQHWTSGCPYHKSHGKAHVGEGAVLFQPTLSGAFYPPKVRITPGVSPTIAHTLGWSIFHSHLLMLRCWCTTSTAWVRAAAVRRDRRGHCFTFISDSLFPHPGSHPCETPSWGGQGEARAQRAEGFISFY